MCTICVPLIRNIEVSLNWITLLIGAIPNSTMTMVLRPLTRISFGTYNVICGPEIGQYRPMLKPFMYMNPYFVLMKRNKKNHILIFYWNTQEWKIYNHTYLSPSCWINECITYFNLVYIERFLKNYWLRWKKCCFSI